MRPFLTWAISIIMILSMPIMTAAAPNTDNTLLFTRALVQEYSPRTLTRAQTKTGFEWQFNSANLTIQKQFEDTIDKKHWIKAEILLIHPFVENGVSKRFILIKQQPVQFKQALGENIVGWIDGIIFAEKNGKWEKETSGYNLGYVSGERFNPKTDFRMTSLSAKQNAFIIRQETTSGDVSLELTEYYITAINHTLKKVAEIIVAQNIASPEPDGTFRHDTAVVEAVAPQLETFSPLRVKTTLQWVSSQNKVVRQHVDAIFYQFDPQSNEYIVQSFR